MRLHPGRFLRAGAVCAAALPPWGNPGTLCARPLPSLDVPGKAHPPSGTRRAEEPAYRMGAAKGICPSFREPLPLLPLIVAASCERVCVFSWTTPQSKPLWPLRGILTRVTALGWGVLWPFYLFCHLQPVPWGKQLPGTQEPPQHCCPPARLQPRTASPPGARSCVCLCHTALLTAAPTWESRALSEASRGVCRQKAALCGRGALLERLPGQPRRKKRRLGPLGRPELHRPPMQLPASRWREPWQPRRQTQRQGAECQVLQSSPDPTSGSSRGSGRAGSGHSPANCCICLFHLPEPPQGPPASPPPSARPLPAPSCRDSVVSASSCVCPRV